MYHVTPNKTLKLDKGKPDTFNAVFKVQDKLLSYDKIEQANRIMLRLQHTLFARGT